MSKNKRGGRGGLRVSGLENIGKLVARAPEAVAPAPTPKVHGITAESIVTKTLSNLRSFGGGSAGEAISVEAHNLAIIGAAVREALNLGHSMAVGQNSAVEELVKKQYDARTALTMPAVVAAIMEQTGIDSLVLDLDAVGTVFKRCRLEHDTLEAVGHPNTMEYSLVYLADADAGSDTTWALAP